LFIHPAEFVQLLPADAERSSDPLGHAAPARSLAPRLPFVLLSPLSSRRTFRYLPSISVCVLPFSQ
jgi:hypothetical protein